MRTKLLCALLLCMSLISCNEDNSEVKEPESIVVTEISMSEIPSQGTDDAKITFDALQDWSVEVAPSTAEVYPTMGYAGEGKSIYVEVPENLTEEVVEYTVTITCNQKTFETTLKQLPTVLTPFQLELKSKGINISSVDELSVDSAIGVEDAEYIRDNFNGRTLSFKAFVDNVVPESAFEQMQALVTVTLPDEVTTFGDKAFYGCNSIESVNTPSSLIKIGAWAFRGCVNLQSFTFIAGIEVIDTEAFWECKSLTVVEVKRGITEVSRALFKDCTSLESVELPSGVTRIGAMAFEGCTNLTDIDIKYGVTVLGGSLFSGCESLVTINLPNSITTMEEYQTFSHCTLLENYNTFDSDGTVHLQSFPPVSELPDAYFGSCLALTNVDLSSLTGLDWSTSQSVFTGCANLSRVTLPADMNVIPGNFFYECSSLRTVTIPESVTEIGEYSFAHSGLTSSIEIPKNVNIIFRNAFEGVAAGWFAVHMRPETPPTLVPVETTDEVKLRGFVPKGQYWTIFVPKDPDYIPDYNNVNPGYPGQKYYDLYAEAWGYVYNPTWGYNAAYSSYALENPYM